MEKVEDIKVFRVQACWTWRGYEGGDGVTRRGIGLEGGVEGRVKWGGRNGGGTDLPVAVSSP